MSATFTAEGLLAVAMNQGITPVIRLLMLVAERANYEGVSTWETGELFDLIYDGEGSKTVDHVLDLAVANGYILPGSTTDEVRLDTALVQPSGFPNVGAVYGELTLVREVNEGVWLTRCSCGAGRTFRIEYLTSGLTSRCNNAQKHRIDADIPR